MLRGLLSQDAFRLSTRGWLLTPESRKMVGKAVDKAILQAREQHYRMSKGDYRPDLNADRFPQLEHSKATGPRGSQTLIAVFEAYANEAQLKPATVKRGRPVINQVAADVPCIADLTREWVLAWKDRLVARGLAMKSIREVYLASLRAVCEWAVTNSKLAENPVLRIKLKVPRKSKTRSLGYTDDEAQKILIASMQGTSLRKSPAHRAARRWVPTLCA
jgi:hypothetical protein